MGKRIRNLSHSATEAELIFGNYLALDTTDETKKIPGNLIAGKSRVDYLDKFAKAQIYCTDGGVPYIEQKPATGGSIYFKFPNLALRGIGTGKTWSSMSTIATELGETLVTSPGGVTNTLELKDTKCLVLDLLTRTLYIKGRDDILVSDYVILKCVGGILVNDLYTFSNSSEQFYRSRLQMYVSAKLPYLEQPWAANSSIYFKFEEIYVRCFKTNYTYNPSSLATKLGVSLVTSHEGVENCIEIPNTKALVFSFGDGMLLKDRTDVNDGDVVLLSTVGGLNVSTPWAQFKTMQDTNKNRIQVYTSDTPYIEQTPYTINASIYVKFGTLYLRGQVPTGAWTLAQVASAIGVSTTTSPQGVTGCIEIPNTKTLVVNQAGKLILKNRDNVLDTDYVIIACVSGGVVACNLQNYLFDKVKKLEENFLPSVSFAQAKNEGFAESVLGCGDTESFIFFTDPHCLGSNSVIDDSTQAQIDKIKLAVDKANTNAVNKIICGGDWLNSGDTRVSAVEKMSYISGLFGSDKFMTAVGNHDTNTFGKYDSEAAANTGLLTNDEIRAALSPREKAPYFKQGSTFADYFVLDSGTEDVPMTEYRWEQIDWLANELNASQKDHGIVCIHIFSRGYQSTDDWAANITHMANHTMNLCLACNARTTVTLNGTTYDFTNAKIKVSFILTGHTHYDYVDTTQSIPVVVTKNTQANSSVNLDLALADFTNHKLYLTRIGDGNDREVTIV